MSTLVAADPKSCLGPHEEEGGARHVFPSQHGVQAELPHAEVRIPKAVGGHVVLVGLGIQGERLRRDQGKPFIEVRRIGILHRPEVPIASVAQEGLGVDIEVERRAEAIAQPGLEGHGGLLDLADDVERVSLGGGLSHVLVRVPHPGHHGAESDGGPGGGAEVDEGIEDEGVGPALIVEGRGGP
jgi:hypothetical protein